MARQKKTRQTHRKGSPPSAFAEPPPHTLGTHVAARPEDSRAWLLRYFSRRDVLAVLALAVLVGVSYVPALQGGFVWDDVIFVAEQPMIREASGLRGIWFSPADLKEGHYWPLVYTSFWLEHKLWGLAPAGYHAVNVLLHLINSLLVWRLLIRLAVPGDLVIAAVFAVHPVHVESVAWIIARKDVLSALFYLTAVLAWIRFTEAPRWGRYLPALALFAAGMLCKSIVVTLPAALLIWHWWQRGRVTRTDLLRLVPFVVVAVGITVADLSYYASTEQPPLGYSPLEGVLIAARALWFYAGKLLWPTDLAVIYPLWEIRIGDPLAWAYVVAAAALAVLLWYGRRRIGRGPLAGALFFTVTLAPVLGFVDFSYMEFSFVADRYQYLASMGVLAVLIGAAVHGANKLPRAYRIGACGLALAVVAVLGTLTWRQAGIYRDEVTFFRHVVAFNPEARGAHSNLGGALVKLKRFEEAEEQLGRALELDPRDLTALQSMAESRRKQERYEEALQWYRAALEIDRRYALAHAGMGETMFHLERYEEALKSMAQAVALQPDLPMAASLHPFMGRASRELGRLEVAAEHFGRARELQPRDPGTLDELAEALRFQNRYEEAIEPYRAALEIDPDYAPAHAGLGDTLFRLERYEEALKSMARAVALQPDLPMAGLLHRLMGQAAQELGRPEAAAEHYADALRIDPHDGEAIDRLAMLRFGQQRYAAALDLYQTLLQISPGNANTHFNLGATLYYLGRVDEAVRSFEHALSLDPALEKARTGLEQLRAIQQQREP